VRVSPPTTARPVRVVTTARGSDRVTFPGLGWCKAIVIAATGVRGNRAPLHLPQAYYRKTDSP